MVGQTRCARGLFEAINIDTFLFLQGITILFSIQTDNYRDICVEEFSKAYRLGCNIR